MAFLRLGMGSPESGNVKPSICADFGRNSVGSASDACGAVQGKRRELESFWRLLDGCIWMDSKRQSSALMRPDHGKCLSPSKRQEWGECDCARGGQRNGQATREREEKKKRRAGISGNNGLPVPSPPYSPQSTLQEGPRNRSQSQKMNAHLQQQSPHYRSPRARDRRRARLRSLKPNGAYPARKTFG